MMKKIAALLCCVLMLMNAIAFAQEDTAAPPAMPEGTMGTPPSGTPPDGTPPDGTPPDGTSPDGTPPDGMGGGAPGGAPSGAPGGVPGGFGGSGEVTQGTAATTLEEDATITGGTFGSSGDNENALRVTGAISVRLDGVTIDKTAGATANTEDSDFYGQNAGLLATDGATVSISGATILTNASGGNAVFSYGQGTALSISDSTIRTQMNNSGGIHVAGGASLLAKNLDVETQGNSAAAIRSDRGGGALSAEGGSYVTNGTGSPAIYSTAAISVNGATLTANHSEAIVVEGKNSVTLTDCVVSGHMDGTYAEDNNENIHAVMIYQSMSGDADVGQSHFSMTGGKLISLSGDMIYVTNTSCTIELEDVALTYASDNLLQVVGNSSTRGWGKAGANGGNCVFTAKNQTMEGNITVDSISTLDISMESGTVFTGSINPEGQGGTVNVRLDDASRWSLTADAYVTSFTGNMDNVVTNGYTLHIAE